MEHFGAHVEQFEWKHCEDQDAACCYDGATEDRDAFSKAGGADKVLGNHFFNSLLVQVLTLRKCF